MAKVISIHSFRGGTGKSNTTANLSTLLAMSGQRVAVIDTDIQSPGIHVLFGLDDDNMGYSLNDYLYGKCEIKDAAHDLTTRLHPEMKGKLFLIPSSMKLGEITKFLREGYDVGLLNDGYRQIIRQLNLDALVIDTHPGVNEETLLSIAISSSLAIIMRPDTQDYQGTSVTVDVARRLNVPRLSIIVNKCPQSLNLVDVKAQVEKAYNCKVAGVFPHSDEMMNLASSGIFVLRYPDHPMTEIYRQTLANLIN